MKGIWPTLERSIFYLNDFIAYLSGRMIRQIHFFLSQNVLHTWTCYMYVVEGPVVLNINFFELYVTTESHIYAK